MSDLDQISVVVPTYRRPLALARCLAGLLAQSRAADEIVLVVRADDEETNAYLDGQDAPALPLRTATVSVPGHVCAKNAGLEAASGGIVAFVDDDAVPRPDWLRLIEEHLRSDDAVAAVGGRDWLHLNGQVVDEVQAVIGKLHWFGRLQGQHQLGAGPPRDVDTLRGGNMAVRVAAVGPLRFDSRLRGVGFQPHDDVAFCLALKRAGWRIVYDPDVAVDHYPGLRSYEQRDELAFSSLRDYAHNEAVAVLPNVPLTLKVINLCYGFLVGSRAAPGLLQVPRILLRGEAKVFLRFAAAVVGRASGLAEYLRSPDPRPNLRTPAGQAAAERNAFAAGFSDQS